MKPYPLIFVVFLFSLTLFACGGEPEITGFTETGNGWRAGFASVEIPLPETEDPLYIAGYRNGYEITGVLDLPKANALWLDVGGSGILLIGIDCVGLGRDTVLAIRDRLSDFRRTASCAAVHVYATHTHAGVDTLGLWGPVAQNGKNESFQENLITAAVNAGKAAYENRTSGQLLYGATETEAFQADSRAPEVWDSTLHQLRFLPEDPAIPGTRLLFYAAHAEALRGKNTMVSRDFPGEAARRIDAATGENTMFLPGAIGGLIMTPALTTLDTGTPEGAVDNLRLTGKRLAEYALSVTEERPLSPRLGSHSTELVVPLDNTLFLYYRFLGILGNPVSRDRPGETGYSIHSEVGLLTLGDMAAALLPGEIFPELVLADGGYNGTVPTLEALAAEHGIDALLVVGLCNDELGYILPPEDFLLHPTLPYLAEANGDHYEETNSSGIHTAALLAEAFGRLLPELSPEN